MPARKQKPARDDGRERIPPGATKQASDRTSRPGGPGHTKLDDRHAAGTPGGGTEVGGLAGTNSDAGDVEDEMAGLAEAGGTGTAAPEAEGGPPYAGNAGGAVGGTPAEERSRGGRTGRGLRPGGDHPSDSTIGTEPEQQ